MSGFQFHNVLNNMIFFGFLDLFSMLDQFDPKKKSGDSLQVRKLNIFNNSSRRASGFFDPIIKTFAKLTT